jgi:hypothetical protein
MNGGTITNNTATESGGGVYVAENATFTMNGGTISGNTANGGSWTGGGGVLCLGTFTMYNGVISGNTCTFEGGGVFSKDTTGNFTMHGGLISENTAPHGGGVCGSGAVTINGGTISGNTSTSEGGGISVNNGNTTINGGIISGNTATGNGGGLATNSGTVNFYGGTISGNTANGNGNGIYLESPITTINMKGTALVTPDNDVYLPIGRSIRIDGDLSAPLAAIIKPQTPGSNPTVLTGSSYLANNYWRFGVSTAGYAVQSDGTISNAAANVVARRVVGGKTVNYAALDKAIAAASGTPYTPDVITLLAAQTIATAVDYGTTAAGKHIMIKRGSGVTGSMFTVSSGSLTLGSTGGSFILDGGAVWTGGTANPPDPAHGATNSGLTATETMVKVTGGTFTMNAGAVLQNNDNTTTTGNNETKVGAVGLSGGSYTLAGGTIKNNRSYTGSGAVSVAQGRTFTMSGGEISGNYAMAESQRGGAIFTHGTTTMTGGTITGNAYFGHSASVFVWWQGIFNMQGGSIGGSIVVPGSGVNIFQGGTDTSVSIPDDAVPVGVRMYTTDAYENNQWSTARGVFKMSGSAVVGDGDVVSVLEGATIQITGNLTGDTPVATIVPDLNYRTGVQVLSGSALSTNYNKFAVTPDPDTGAWHIGSDGKLAQ